MHLTINHFLVLASILFCIGLYGVLVKRNAVAILMCIELMLNAVNILLVAFNHLQSQALRCSLARYSLYLS